MSELEMTLEDHYSCSFMLQTRKVFNYVSSLCTCNKRFLQQQLLAAAVSIRNMHRVDDRFSCVQYIVCIIYTSLLPPSSSLLRNTHNTHILVHTHHTIHTSHMYIIHTYTPHTHCTHTCTQTHTLMTRHYLKYFEGSDHVIHICGSQPGGNSIKLV